MLWGGKSGSWAPGLASSRYRGNAVASVGVMAAACALVGVMADAGSGRRPVHGTPPLFRVPGAEARARGGERGRGTTTGELGELGGSGMGQWGVQGSKWGYRNNWRGGGASREGDWGCSNGNGGA